MSGLKSHGKKLSTSHVQTYNEEPIPESTSLPMIITAANSEINQLIADSETPMPNIDIGTSAISSDIGAGSAAAEKKSRHTRLANLGKNIHSKPAIIDMNSEI